MRIDPPTREHAICEVRCEEQTMDGQRFDAIAKALAGSTSRRSVLRVFAGGAAGSVLGLLGAAVAAADKVFVCHKGKTISIDASALSAHLAHADTEGPCCLQTTACRPDQEATFTKAGRCDCACPTGWKECAGGC